MKQKSKLKIMGIIAMVLIVSSFISVKAQSDLIAIDVLLDPGPDHARFGKIL